MKPEFTRFRLKRDALYRRVWDEGVVLHKSLGEVLVLNDVGTRIVELCETGTSARELVTLLAEEYDIEPACLEADIQDFIQHLRDADVIEPLGAFEPELPP
jgi:hypothetical protein